MRHYVPLSIAFLILISIASGAVGGASIKDTGYVYTWSSSILRSAILNT